MPARLVLALAAAGLLAACGPAKPKPDEAITADQLPHIKVGQWEVTTVANGQAQPTRTSCSPAGRLPMPITVRLYGCNAQPTLARTGAGAITVDLNCATQYAIATQHTTISGDFNASFVSQTRLSLDDRQGRPPTVTEVRQSFRYLGACPP